MGMQEYARVWSVALALLLAACTGETAANEDAVIAATATATPPPFNTDIDVIEIMAHTVDPAARAFWAAWGEVYDSNGSHDVSAKTDDEWKKVEDGATMLVLASNTLMLPAYQRKPEADWIKYAKAMSDLAMLGREGADHKDLAVMEKVGAQLDEACDACHAAYRKPS